MKQIIPGVYWLTGLLAGRVYCIEDPDGLTLIDASLSVSAGRILKQIAALGRSPTDVRRILITHAHPDHVGSLSKLKAATGAQIMASALEKPVIQGEMPIPRPPKEKLTGLARYLSMPATTLKAVMVDRVVQDGEVLPEVLGGLQVVATPGHAPGHLAFWQPEKGIVFCGDVIFHLFGFRLPPRLLTVDMDENKRSVKRLVELEPAIVCFGHGLPLDQDTSTTLRTFAQKVGAL